MSSPDQYDIVVVPLSEEDGGGFHGYVPDLPGCSSDGETRLETMSNTEDALNEWLTVQLERGVDVPDPGAARREAHEQIDDLLKELTALVEFRESAEEKIASLERKIAEWSALRKEEPGLVRTGFATVDSSSNAAKKRAH